LSIHVYEIRPRADKRGFNLIFDALPFGHILEFVAASSGEKKLARQRTGRTGEEPTLPVENVKMTEL